MSSMNIGSKSYRFMSRRLQVYEEPKSLFWKMTYAPLEASIGLRRAPRPALVPHDRRIDLNRPRVDAAAQGLHALKTLLTQPDRNVH
jgi:hypothetical protein